MVIFCSRSSPTAAAARIPASTSLESIIFRCSVDIAHTPAKQSACNSRRTDNGFASDGLLSRMRRTDRFRLVLMVLVPTIVYVLATQFIGIYVSSTIFIAAFMRVMDKRAWWKVALISIGTSATLFWLFEIQFMVPLPKGPLEALFGY